MIILIHFFSLAGNLFLISVDSIFQILIEIHEYFKILAFLI